MRLPQHRPPAPPQPWRPTYTVLKPGKFTKHKHLPKNVTKKFKFEKLTRKNNHTLNPKVQGRGVDGQPPFPAWPAPAAPPVAPPLEWFQLPEGELRDAAYEAILHQKKQVRPPSPRRTIQRHRCPHVRAGMPPPC